MKKINRLSTIALVALMCLPVSAQVKIHGVYEYMRNDDNDQPIEWVGSIYDENGKYTGKTLYFVPQGLYSMTWDGSALTAPEKDPPVTKEEVINESGQVDMEKAEWATNFNMMSGNSGALYANGQIWTVYSRDMQSSDPEDMFVVRQWDAVTGNLVKEYPHYGEEKILESAGLAFNPIDNRIYGLFYVTAADLPESITSDPDYFEDDDDRGEGRSGLDAGYAIGRLNTETMEVEIITRGLYYFNFVTFAINSEGRAFALTSGGTNGVTVSETDDHMVDLNGNLTGAQLYEFNLTTGNMYYTPVEMTDEETGEKYTEQGPTVGATGYCSQYRRQAACFAKSNPNKMYWNGFFNSGKGYNEWGSWGNLPDKDWKTNGKYDTCLYEVDIETGKATRLDKIHDRYRFSCLWVDGDDCSDGQEIDNTTGIENVTINTSTLDSRLSTKYNLAGQKVSESYKGIVIQNGKKVVVK